MTHDLRSEVRSSSDLGRIGGDDLEPLDGVGDVLDLLEDAVGVDVAVCAPDGAVGVAHLLLGGEAVLMCPSPGGQVRTVETAEIKSFF